LTSWEPVCCPRRTLLHGVSKYIPFANFFEFSPHIPHWDRMSRPFSEPLDYSGLHPIELHKFHFALVLLSYYYHKPALIQQCPFSNICSAAYWHWQFQTALPCLQLCFTSRKGGPSLGNFRVK
jgi:hypothetical protein